MARWDTWRTSLSIRTPGMFDIWSLTPRTGGLERKYSSRQDGSKLSAGMTLTLPSIYLGTGSRRARNTIRQSRSPATTKPACTTITVGPHIGSRGLGYGYGSGAHWQPGAWRWSNLHPESRSRTSASRALPAIGDLVLVAFTSTVRKTSRHLGNRTCGVFTELR